MPVELKVLGYAALLQFVQFIVMAIPVNLQLGVAYTGGNRDEQRQATGMVDMRMAEDDCVDRFRIERKIGAVCLFVAATALL